MTVVAVKPSIEDVLEHHGIKGMKWGVRRTPSSSGTVGSSPPTKRKIITKKRAIKTGVILAGIGAGVAIAVLSKNGPNLRSSPEFKRTAARGVKVVTVTNKTHPPNKAFHDMVWKHSVSELMADINSAHATQTQNMRRTMGAMGANYNPRDNPFTPEARRLRLT